MCDHTSLILLRPTYLLSQSDSEWHWIAFEAFNEHEYDTDTDDDGGDSHHQSDDSNISDNDIDENDDDLRHSLAAWAVSKGVNQTAVSSLLKILNKHHPSLPLDARTLLGTRLHYFIKETSILPVASTI
jgi:hypothetical protein